MDTGEVFGWIFFFVFVSILFFAAFGSASVTEDSVEEYINNLMAQEENAIRTNRKR
tara:strand:- start:1783 stop:1950 length:168 start_codon:yes stop_codon:yes gene_type:complete